MSFENTDSKIWKYFKIGDIVRDSDNSIWGNTEFEIYRFHGNWYCPLISTYICGKFYPSGNKQNCILDIRGVKLLNALHRPFRNMKKVALLKLMSKGNVEARREFIMRVNTKTL